MRRLIESGAVRGSNFVQVGLRGYWPPAETFAWKFGTTKHVAGLLQFLTKKDFMPFFEKYYWGTEMP